MGANPTFHVCCSRSSALEPRASGQRPSQNSQTRTPSASERVRSGCPFGPMARSNGAPHGSPVGPRARHSRPLACARGPSQGWRRHFPPWRRHPPKGTIVQYVVDAFERHLTWEQVDLGFDGARARHVRRSARRRAPRARTTRGLTFAKALAVTIPPCSTARRAARALDARAALDHKTEPSGSAAANDRATPEDRRPALPAGQVCVEVVPKIPNRTPHPPLFPWSLLRVGDARMLLRSDTQTLSNIVQRKLPHAFPEERGKLLGLSSRAVSSREHGEKAGRST